METPGTPISYAQFGHNFILHVISATRIRREVDALLESSIEGVVKKLPADLMVAKYAFKILDVRVLPIPEKLPEVSFELQLDGRIALAIKLMGLSMDFGLQVGIQITVDVSTYAPLLVKLHLNRVQDRDVHIEIDPQGVPEEVLTQLNIIEPLARDQIVEEVNKRIASEELTQATTIDVLQLAESAALGASEAFTLKAL